MRVEGEGLLLRPFVRTDAPVVVEQFADPAATRWTAWDAPDPYTLADAEQWIAGHPEQESRDGSATCAVVADGAVVGCVELHRRDGFAGPTGEVGYWTLASATGRGIATRATRVLARRCFADGAVRLELTAHPENGASQRVALGAGFRREGLLRGAMPGRHGQGREDRVLYARLAGDADEPTPRLLPDLREPLSDGIVAVRPQLPTDAEAALAAQQDPEYLRWLPASVTPPADLAAVRRTIALADDAWLAGRQAACSVIEVGTGRRVGQVTLRMTEAAIGTGQLGWSTAPPHRGKGYASRGVRLLAGWAFDVVGLQRLEAPAGVQNAASLAVGARVGFRQEGVLRQAMPGPDSRYDLMMQALTPADLIAAAR